MPACGQHSLGVLVVLRAIPHTAMRSVIWEVVLPDQVVSVPGPARTAAFMLSPGQSCSCWFAFVYGKRASLWQSAASS